MLLQSRNESTLHYYAMLQAHSHFRSACEDSLLHPYIAAARLSGVNTLLEEDRGRVKKQEFIKAVEDDNVST